MLIKNDWGLVITFPWSTYMIYILFIFIFDLHLVGSFNHLEKIVSWDDYSQYMEKCSKPPTSVYLLINEPWFFYFMRNGKSAWRPSARGPSRPSHPGRRSTYRVPWFGGFEITSRQRWAKTGHWDEKCVSIIRWWKVWLLMVFTCLYSGTIHVPPRWFSQRCWALLQRSLWSVEPWKKWQCHWGPSAQS